MKLVNETQMPVADQSTLRIVDRRKVLATHAHLTGSRRIQATQQLQQGRLAGPRVTDDRNALAGRHAQIDAIQYIDDSATFHEAAAQAMTLQRRHIIHNATPLPARSVPRARPDR